MSKTVICCTSMMSTLFIVFHLCMVTTCMCPCTGVSKNSWSSTVSVNKKSNLVWPNSFLMQGSNRLQYKQLAMLLAMAISLAMVVYATCLCNVLNFTAGPQLHVAYVIASYYFCVELWNTQLLVLCSFFVSRFECGSQNHP